MNATDIARTYFTRVIDMEGTLDVRVIHARALNYARDCTKFCAFPGATRAERDSRDRAVQEAYRVMVRTAALGEGII